MEQLSDTFNDSQYEILGELGRGTTGTVYEAWDKLLNRRVALKLPVLAPDSERWAKRKRFLRECQALAWLTSEPGINIPRLHMVAENTGGQIFSVREIVDGSTLEQQIREGSIDLAAGLAVIAEMARMVEWVHGRGFSHRNLSAANVLIAQNDSPWLIGFGRASPLTGSPLLPPGATGTSTEADVRGLQEMVQWLCGALHQPVPAPLQLGTTPGSAVTAEAFGEAVIGHLRSITPPAARPKTD
jgi:serine/threonine protein kinase